MLVPHMVVYNFMRGNICTHYVTKCLFRYACSISTMLQPNIHQHDHSVYDCGINNTINWSLTRHCRKTYLSHPDGLPHHKTFLWILLCVGIFLTPFVGIYLLLASFCIFVLQKKTSHELPSSDQSMPVFCSTKYYNRYHYMCTVSLPSRSDIFTGCSSYQEATAVQLLSGLWWHTPSLCG